MDRTNAPDHVDIGGGRRGSRDEDLTGGIDGTALIANDRNQTQEELFSIIEGLGLQEDGAKQYLSLLALRRAAGLNVTPVTASGTLVADNAGLVVVDASGGNITITLPAASAVAPVFSGSNSASPGKGANPTTGGSLPATTDAHALRCTFVRTDSSTNIVSIARAGTNLIDGATSVGVRPGERVELTSNGQAAWYVTGGAQATRSLSSSDYVLLPDNLILQWGSIAVGDIAGSTPKTGTASLPLTFPNAAFKAIGSLQDAASGGCGLTSFVISALGTLSWTVEDLLAGAGFQNISINYIALGK